MLQEMKFYFDQMESAKGSHRKISNRFKSRFNTSPSAIRDILIRGGYIEFDYMKRQGETQKFHYYYKLTGKKFDEAKVFEQIVVQEPEVEVSDFWSDGTPKSSNNAFNWKSMKSNLYSKREIVQSQQKYHNNFPITAYSRA